MKKIFVCTLMIAALALTAMAADVSGKWTGTFTPEGQDAGNAYMVLKQSGTTLTGTAGPDENQQWPISSGKVEGNKLSGQVTSPDGATYKFTLMLEGEHIKGNVEAKSGDQSIKGMLDVTRAKS
jgi:opacity protein-like surface antigen